jgi:hypothetical protein
LTKIHPPHSTLSLKQQPQKTEKEIESCKREKQIMYEGKPIRITADFSMKILKARRAWSEVYLGTE